MLERLRIPCTWAALLAAGVAGGVLLGSRAPVADAGEPSKAVVAAYFSPDGGIETALVQAIEAARAEVLVAVYNFTSRPLSGALKRAHGRGVQVRVLTDPSNRKIPHSQIDEIEAAGIPVITLELGKTGDNQPRRYHHKYAVIDRQVVCTGSFNWTRQAETDNHENLVVLQGRQIARDFLEDFQAMWEKHAKD